MTTNGLVLCVIGFTPREPGAHGAVTRRVVCGPPRGGGLQGRAPLVTPWLLTSLRDKLGLPSPYLGQRRRCVGGLVTDYTERKGRVAREV